jgi:glucokinase
MEKDLILGADVGGSHITVGLINMQTGHVEDDSIVRKRVNSHAPANEIIAIWTDAINEAAALTQHAVTRVGIAMPGPFDYENGICLIKGFDKYETLYGLNIKELLAEKLQFSTENIRMRNDAEAFLEGEMFGGAAKGFNRVIGITLGTGLGSARCIDGPTEDAELSVWPFHDGIIEDYVSTRGLIKTYREITGFPIKDVKSLADSYHSGAGANKAFKIFASNLSIFLRMFIQRDRPEVVVVGGNISHAWDLFMPDVKKHLADLMENTNIVKSQLDENAALIGGACCFLPSKAMVEKVYVNK